LYSSLERLGQVMDVYQGARVLADKRAETVKGGLEAFDSEWRKTSAVVREREREARSKDWTKGPAAIRALAEVSESKAMPLVDAGRAYGTATQPKDGLFTLGEAEGNAEFVRFCAALEVARKGEELPRRSLAPELDNLQAKANAAFVPPRSIELHSQFIQLNSTLKLARDLDGARMYSGALYQYLQAVLDYGMLMGAAPAPDGAKQASLKNAIAALNKKVENSTNDDSIAEMFVQRAAQMVRSDGPPPPAEVWKGVAVFIDEVMPAYYAALKPVACPPPGEGRTVDIRLVRWPYT